MDVEALREQYGQCEPRAHRLCATLTEQLGELLHGAGLTLGVPLESRVKSWSSVEKKLERTGWELARIEELDDLVGLRLILLFRPDLDAADALIREHFEVQREEDTARRLDEAQFGYQSRHYVVKLQASWTRVPSMADLGELRCEIQVRTLSQHIWAAASHKLQYKQEESVPPPMRRAIHRVSALLETVDLEFERVLQERQEYREVAIPAALDSARLNVDLLASVLGDVYPETDGDEDQEYDELLRNMTALDVESVGALNAILKRHYEATMSKDRGVASQRLAEADFSEATREGLESGRYFSNVGLARNALRFEFGARLDEVMRDDLTR